MATDPIEAWRRLREAEGRRVTIIDLYELVADARGLAPHELPVAERLDLARSVMPDIWPGFALTPGSDRHAELIRVVAYDEQWPRRFERWRADLHERLGETAVRIEHIGSTSVPGLAAKPIVDIQVSVRDLADEPSYVPQLARTGLQLRSRDDLHRFFRPFPDQLRDVHVHVCAADSEWEREHLLFRDFLRSQADARDRYAAAKQDAVSMWADDGWAYTDAKTEVILTILEEAERWAGRPGS